MPTSTRAPASDPPPAASPWRPRAFLDLLRRTLVEGTRGGAPKEAALLAYTILFTLGPLLVLAVGVAGLLVGADAARDALVRELSRLTGGRGGPVVDDLLEGATRTSLGILGAALGLLALVALASLAFAQLKWSLNRVWAVRPRAHDRWRARALGALRRSLGSAGGALSAAFLLLVSFLGGALVAAFGARLAALLPGDAPAAGLVLHLLLSLLVAWALFAALFKLLPDAEVAWRDVGVGAAATTLLFLGGQVLLGLWFARGPFGDAYGAASGVFALLLWVYYSSLLLLYGAQFTQVYANLYGSRVRPSREAEAQADAEHEDDKRPGTRGTRRGKAA